MRTLVYFLFFFSYSISAQSLDQCVDEMLENNPRLLAYSKAYEVSDEQTRTQVGMGETKVSFGYFATRPQTRTGEQVAKIGISQGFNWFGSALLKKERSQDLSNAQYQEWIKARRLLIEGFSLRYISAQFNMKYMMLISEQIELQKELQANFRNVLEGSSNESLGDLLKLDIQLNDLENQLDNAVVYQENLIKQMNVLMGREKDAQLALSELPEFPKELAKIEETELEVHPEILKYEALQNALISEQELFSKQQLPDFTIGLDYIPVQAYDQTGLAGNGQDIFMPMLSMSIPVFGQKNKSKSKVLNLKQEQLNLDKKAKYDELDLMLEQTLMKREQAFNQLNRARQNEILYKEIVQIQYDQLASGNGSVKNLIEEQKEIINTGLEVQDAALMFFQSELRLAYLIGK
ncbi:TolC family protein [Flavobacteriaceae bacterium]|nr:TolC family protein [Flavobacteriaceae bacterium]